MRGLGLCTEGACITAGRGWTRSANPRGLLTKESQLHQGTCTLCTRIAIQYMYMYMHVIHIQMYMYMSREQCRGFDSHVRYIAHWKMGSPGVVVLYCYVACTCTCIFYMLYMFNVSYIVCIYMYMYMILYIGVMYMILYIGVMYSTRQKKLPINGPFNGATVPVQIPFQTRSKPVQIPCAFPVFSAPF